MKIPVGISARHMHITKETYELLFGASELIIRNPLNQPNEFATASTVDIKNGDVIIKNVRILGAFRAYNQVEISASDARVLGLNPKTRASGDLNNTDSITIIGPLCELTLDNALIIANRHFHLTTKMATQYNIKNGDYYTLTVDNGIKNGQMEVFAKVLDEAYFEVHLDTDDANAFQLNQGEELIINIEE